LEIAMLIHIERGSSAPISRQIADQVRAACLSGSAEIGERLPSVRELARELGVNQNTVLRVYERLASEGLLERRQGEGTFVRGQGTARRVAVQKQQIEEELAAQVRRALMLGLTGKELSQLLERVVREAKSDVSER
jgi:GntR family transcriptional regulator